MGTDQAVSSGPVTPTMTGFYTFDLAGTLQQPVNGDNITTVINSTLRIELHGSSGTLLAAADVDLVPFATGVSSMAIPACELALTPQGQPIAKVRRRCTKSVAASAAYAAHAPCIAAVQQH